MSGHAEDLEENVDDCLEQCERILEAYASLPRSMVAGTANVRRKVVGIRTWAQTFGKITSPQQTALDAIEDEMGRLLY